MAAADVTPPLQGKVPPRRSVVDWFALNPRVGLAGTVASILGIPLALYLSIATQPTRNLTITSDPPVAIMRAGQASSIDVLYYGAKIKTDVYARQVYIWNAGNDSIRHEHVLEHIGIVIPHARILEARVKKVSRPLISLQLVGGTPDDRLMLSWSILEHNDGAAIDVTAVRDMSFQFPPKHKVHRS
jgi:hypothetical protein